MNITIEEKREYLKSHGWYQMWHEDNWLESSRHYVNPDCAGMDTESAYNKETNSMFIKSVK